MHHIVMSGVFLFSEMFKHALENIARIAVMSFFN